MEEQVENKLVQITSYNWWTKKNCSKQIIKREKEKCKFFYVDVPESYGKSIY